MVNLGAIARAGLALALLTTPGLGETPPADDEVQQALRSTGAPWYDASRDAARPVWPVERREVEGGGSQGSSTVFGILVALLAIVAWFAWTARVQLPTPTPPQPRESKAAGAARVGLLTIPDGLDVDLTDPWAEALRRRATGDLAGAIVALFVHQVGMLNRLGLARAVPGDTARQVVRSVAAREVRLGIEPTLRLFEEVYYGRRAPSPRAFEAAWSAAEALERAWPRGQEGGR
jgi:hypothetical protein